MKEILSEAIQKRRHSDWRKKEHNARQKLPHGNDSGHNGIAVEMIKALGIRVWSSTQFAEPHWKKTEDTQRLANRGHNPNL